MHCFFRASSLPLQPQPPSNRPRRKRLIISPSHQSPMSSPSLRRQPPLLLACPPFPRPPAQSCPPLWPMSASITRWPVGSAISSPNSKTARSTTASRGSASCIRVSTLCASTHFFTPAKGPVIRVEHQPQLFLQDLIEKPKVSPMRDDPTQPISPVTYASQPARRCPRRLQPLREDRDALIADVQWLIRAANGGSYTYDDRYARLPTLDNDSQMPGISPGQQLQPAPEPGLGFATTPSRLTHRL